MMKKSLLVPILCLALAGVAQTSANRAHQQAAMLPAGLGLCGGGLSPAGPWQGRLAPELRPAANCWACIPLQSLAQGLLLLAAAGWVSGRRERRRLQLSPVV